MARRSVTGQLNMFDLFYNVEPGEVQMVSLMPEAEPEIEIEPEVKTQPEIEAGPEIETGPEIEVEAEPEIETEPEVELEAEVELVVEPRGSSDEKVAMSRSYEIDGECIEIAYINYNKVRITKGKKVSEIKEFENSKDAVNYYVEKMQELEKDE